MSTVVGFGSNQIRYWLHTDPCSLLTVGWVVLILRMPRVFYISMIKFALLDVLFERTYAMHKAKTYENQRPVLGVLLLTSSVSLSCILIWYGYRDFDLLKLYVVINTTTGSETHYKVVLFYAIVMACDAATLALLYVFSRVNEKRKNV
ncbi:hypothetical protein AAVH_12021 [Aphelenchoides avenae]|nr:hypothetical protein AAVH_12021 [Aphelenchus avenae]